MDRTDDRRRAATPPEVMPARLPLVPARRTPRRSEPASEVAVTVRVEKLPIEPEPLPPSPAAADASRWLEREQPQFDAPPTLVSESSDRTQPVASASHPAVHVGHSTTFTALLAVTMLVVGMILGAFIFGH
ncbi:MAG TPA: hypothetical protein VHE35_16595 [Kofleriaceae bacterium]|nr:hypothetical protein [Kofleriaceae bacterium]